LASDYCYSFELKRALKRHASQEACVIPVILRSCDWKNTSFGRLQVLPTNGKPIESWDNRDEAFTDVVRGLRRVLQQNLNLIEIETTSPDSSVIQPIVISKNKIYKRREFLWLLKLSGVTAASALVLKLLNDNSLGITKVELKKISFVFTRVSPSGKLLERPTGSVMIFEEKLGDDISIAMVKIPTGKFKMGSPINEKNRHNNESPWHDVSVPEFYLGQTLITQKQWKAIMGNNNNPSRFKGDKLPVDSVTWLKATEFCRKLSKKTGRTYRLPSEAEWEYACRAGTTSPFAFGETITQ
jgi:formylglycine-generating enzyme required for sulfatase activity